MFYANLGRASVGWSKTYSNRDTIGRIVGQKMQTFAVDQIGSDEQLILQAMDSIIAERRIVSQQLLRQSVSEQLSAPYDIIVRRLIERGALEEAYAEGFELGLRRISGSLSCHGHEMIALAKH